MADQTEKSIRIRILGVASARLESNRFRASIFSIQYAFLGFVLLICLTAPPARAQFGGRTQTTNPFPSQDAVVTVVVNVREMGGGPLEGGAFVKLTSDFKAVHLTASTHDAGAATFPSILAGDYQIEVSSAGYKTHNETAAVMAGPSSYNVYIYMQPETAAGDLSAPPSGTRMTPKLQSEMDKAAEKMRKQQFDEAQKHFEKAAKMAPGNPDVQYMWGMLEYYQQHYDLARTKLETAISINPNHERALVSLGEIQLRQKQSAQAVQTLEKAFLVNGADWRMHYLLAFAYADQKDFAKAETHAQRAADLGGKAHSAQARIMLGRILTSDRKFTDARNAFNSVIRDFPADPAATKDAQAGLVAVDKAVESPARNLVPAGLNASPNSSATTTATASAENSSTANLNPAPAPPVSLRPWAPPDIDAKEYVVAPDIPCSLDTVLQRTQMRTMKQIANFEKFMATEHIEHQEIDAYGNSGQIRSKDFTYLVFIRKQKSGALSLEEERDGGENLSEFPTSLASRGLVGLGVFLFDPEYQDDVTYRCEGLSEWRGQAAWEIRFEQKRDVDSRLMSWRNNRGVFPVALKGRAWISSTTYDVIHLETDLRDPMAELELDRDHLAVDYGPVNFNHGQTSLWLPWYAEMYMQLHNKRYHHRHTLTNYTLFSVDTDHQINAPKENKKPE